MVNAVNRLRWQGHVHSANFPGMDGEIPVGEALLGFAIVSLLTNVCLLALRFRTVEDAEKPPPPKPQPRSGPGWVPRALPTTCMIAPTGPQPARRMQLSSAQALHAVLHPGCGGPSAGCSMSGSGTGMSGEMKSDRGEKNLNLLGVTLHLAADVVRSLIVLVAGLLLELGVLTDVARTDAVCALVVGVFVLSGAAAFFCMRVV